MVSTSSAKRILHVFGRMDRGGAELRTLDLLPEFSPDEFAFDFLALSGQRGELDEELRSRGYGVIHCPLRRGFRKSFLALLRSRRYDVVQSHVHLSSGYFLWLAAIAGVPCRVAHFRSPSDGRRSTPGRKVNRFIKRKLVDRFATDIIAVSVSCMEAAWSSDWRTDSRCNVVFNALRAEDWRFAADRAEYLAEFGWQDSCTICVTAGRLGPEKNQATSVEVIEHLRKMGCDARLLLIGTHVNEPYAQKVLRMVSELGLEGIVALPGGRVDIRNLVKSADVMLCPSQREGMPGVVLEACAARTPVVASDLPSVREIAAHLEGVSVVSLDAGVEGWCRAVINALEGTLPGAEDEWPLEGTPFSIDAAAATLKDIYAS
jgi:glycosyltransferase involved in cell wall biosynthesis